MKKLVLLFAVAFSLFVTSCYNGDIHDSTASKAVMEEAAAKTDSTSVSTDENKTSASAVSEKDAKDAAQAQSEEKSSDENKEEVSK